MSTTASARVNPEFTVGDRLRKAREKTGLGQYEFAEETGISRGTVSNYEAKATTEGMKRPYLVAWAVRCDVDLEWLESGKAPRGGGGGVQPDGSMDTCGYPYRQAA